MPTVRLALIQVRGDNQQSSRWNNLMQQLQDAANKKAQIAILPELFLYPYFCIEEKSEFFDLAHSRNSDAMTKLSRFAAEHQMVIIAPYFEKRAAGLYHNSLVVFDADGTEAGHYRKMHIPDDPGFFEKYYFIPGDTGFQCIQTRYAKIGTLICWDQWFPEGARATALLGADLLVYPTAIGWDAKELEASGSQSTAVKSRQVDAWRTIQRSHAISNGVFVAAVNRVGQEGHLNFWGNSFTCGPEGELLCNLNEEEQLGIVDINLERIEEARRTWPFLRDRRIDAYGTLLQRWAE